MPRARNIKYAFFQNDELAEHNDPLGRLLFIGLWTLADYNGNLEYRSKKIKAQLLPYDDVNLDSLAINLDKSGFIRIYSNGDSIYINIPNFLKHQRPHKNEKESGTDIPEYNEKSRQAIDFNTLTINRDLIGINHDDNGSHPPDSGYLNPDTCSLNADVGQPSAAPSIRKETCIEILTHLNKKSGKGFQPTDSNLEFIRARLKEGYSPEDMKRVIDFKVVEWVGDEKMRQYLRPSTLFNREKFNQYAGEKAPQLSVVKKSEHEQLLDMYAPGNQQ